jgi:hypothetical protein
MEEALRFFRAFEAWIYLLLGLGALYFIRNFILAWQELREAAFGLERESAQARLNQAAIVLVFLLVMAISEFVLVSFVAPAMPGVAVLPTPTLDLLASPTTTLAVVEAAPGAAGTPTSDAASAAAATPPASAQAPGCLPGQIEITAPVEGSQISGVVEIKGSANISGFGFYKLEMKRTEEASWMTVLAGNVVRVNDTLGAWNTSLLAPGAYQLSLVVTDNQGRSLPACIVQVNITALLETPQP